MFIAYSLNDTLHLGDPVSIVNKCRVFQKRLLESLSSDSNLGKKKTILKLKLPKLVIEYLRGHVFYSFTSRISAAAPAR